MQSGNEMPQGGSVRDFPTIEIQYWILTSLWHASPLWFIPAVLAGALLALLVGDSLLEENRTNGNGAAIGCLAFVSVTTLTAMIFHI